MEKNEILVIYGDDPVEMAIRVAEAANLAELIGDRGKRIGLKPNLVVSRPASDGATTHPEICRGLINYLNAKGFSNLVILEGAWAGDSTSRAFKECGYTQLARETGTELIDTQQDKAGKYDCRGLEIEICDSARNLDFMINLPVLKGHCQTKVTCALKNNKGLISDREKRRFHSLGLHKPIAHLNTAVRNDFILVDGICGDPDFEEGGNPVYGGRLFAARDPVLCDAWAALQLGYAVHEIPYIGIAEKLGLGCGDPKKAVVKELSAPSTGTGGTGIRTPGKVQQLVRYITEDKACSACYAALISALFRMSPKELDQLGTRISIGQGFMGTDGSHGKGSLGIGRCTSGFSHSCPGCPPSGAAIFEFLRNVSLTG
jgi:uncharacterized protein (DUF362 family)